MSCKLLKLFTFFWDTLCLRNIMEVSNAVPIATLYLDLGVLPIIYEIEMRIIFP